MEISDPSLLAKLFPQFLNIRSQRLTPFLLGDADRLQRIRKMGMVLVQHRVHHLIGWLGAGLLEYILAHLSQDRFSPSLGHGELLKLNSGLLLKLQVKFEK